MVAQLLHYDIYHASNAHETELGLDQPLVLIHGMGSSGRDWQAQVQHFAKNHTVITFDLRGHGNSRCLDGQYSIESFCADVRHTLKHLKVTSCNLVGLSLGGVVSTELALQSPNMVSSLTIVNAPTELKISSIADFFMGLQRVGMAAFCSRSYLAKVMGQRLFPKPEQEDLRAAMADGFCSMDRKAYIKTLFALSGLTLRHRLHRLTGPTMLVSGDRDYWPLEEKEADAARIPACRFEIIEDSGHATPADQPARFNEILEDFISENLRSALSAINVPSALPIAMPIGAGGLGQAKTDRLVAAKVA